MMITTVRSWMKLGQNFWNTQPQFRRIVFFVIIALGVAFFCALFWKIYFSRFAWGAWGDDSPGYQFLAARMIDGLPLIWQDAFGKSALDFFGDYREATWILPTHHEFIHPNGTIASKYPIGASMLMALGGLIQGGVLGIYVVNPLLASMVVLLTGLAAVILFPMLGKWRYWIAAASMLLVTFSPIFISHAVAQPMREIPSMVLLLGSLVIFVPVVRRIAAAGQVDRWSSVGLIGSGLLFGIACSVRETSVMILPAFLLYALLSVLAGRESLKQRLQEHRQLLLKAVVLFAVSCAIGLLPILLNSAKITELNEPFKARDTGEVVLLSNINHIQTVSFQNVFESTGRYRPASGSLPQFWIVMNELFSKLPFFAWLAIAGLAFGLWKGDREERRLVVLLGGWLLGTLTIFSLWINPYSRYIMPMLPIMAIVVPYGLYRIALLLREHSVGRAIFWIWIIVWSVILLVVANDEWEMQKKLRGAQIMEQRSITYADTQTLQQMADAIREREESEGRLVDEQNTVVLFGGRWKHGLSEVFWAQTGVRGVRFPLEEEALAPTDEAFYAYINELLHSGRSVYVWIGGQPSGIMQDFLDQYMTESVDEHAFSFVSDGGLYRLSVNSQ